NSVWANSLSSSVNRMFSFFKKKTQKPADAARQEVQEDRLDREAGEAEQTAQDVLTDAAPEEAMLDVADASGHDAAQTGSSEPAEPAHDLADETDQPAAPTEQAAPGGAL